MTQRPYIQKSAYELADLIEMHTDSLYELKVIYHELTHRRTNFARILRERVNQRIEYLVAVNDYQQQTELFFQSTKYDLTAIAEEFGIDLESDDLRSQVVAITGSGPYQESILRTLVFWSGGTNSDFEIWEDWMIIVLGEVDFDKASIEATIQLSLDRNLQLEFMSQDDFVRYVETREFAPYFRGDPRIYKHPGLFYVSSIGFKWPSLNPATDKHSHKPQMRGNFDHRDDHPLRIIYGYSVSKQMGLTEKERRRRLNHAVKRLGLWEVVIHIADIVNERKLTQPKRMKNAIYLWESDLAWLKRTYYEDSIYVFEWPSY